MKKIVSLAAMIGLLAGSTFAATGTVVFTYGKLVSPNKIGVTWTTGTASTGAVGVTTYQYGDIGRVVFASTASTNYTVYLRDADGVDLLGGRGSTIASNAVTCLEPGLVITDSVGGTTNFVLYCVNGPLTFVVSNNTYSTSGNAYIYLKHN